MPPSSVLSLLYLHFSLPGEATFSPSSYLQPHLHHCVGSVAVFLSPFLHLSFLLFLYIFTSSYLYLIVLIPSYSSYFFYLCFSSCYSFISLFLILFYLPIIFLLSLYHRPFTFLFLYLCIALPTHIPSSLILCPGFSIIFYLSILVPLSLFHLF